MRIRLNREWVWGIAVVLGCAAVWWADPYAATGTVRQAAFERIGTVLPRDFGGTTAVIDIDRTSLEKHGTWPWRRDLIARLVDAAAGQGARVVAVDVLLSGPDRNGPAALARKLSELSDVDLPTRHFADDDKVLAASIQSAGNVVVGLVPDDEGTDMPPIPAPLAMNDESAAADLSPLFARGVEAPHLPFGMGAAGIGALSLREGPLRRVAGVPALAVAGGEVFPGFAVEAVRVATGASAYVLQEEPPSLGVGSLDIPITERAEVLLHLSDPARWSERTVSAWRFLDDPSAFADSLDGRIVLIGAGAPEAAAFVPVAGLPLAPTVQIQADAVDQILGGNFLVRPPRALLWEVAAILVLGGLAVLAAVGLAPAWRIVCEIVLVLVWLAVSVIGFRSFGTLIDPVGPVVTVVLAAAATAFATFVRTRRLKTAIVQKFERYVPPEVVERLIRRPEELRLDGEVCELTALATDIEGFSRMTDSVAPQDLLRALDGYFDLVTQAIVRHGGMVDKIVGDAVLAYFNIPAALPGHAAAAVACAREIVTETEAYRRRDDIARLGLGRTRCGVETGMAIVGDVGGERRLDYTAYGAVVNKAARFEAANKTLKSSICVGPEAAARIDPALLRPLGAIRVHGMDEAMAVFEPWEQETDADIRRQFADAVALEDTDPREAERRMSMVADRLPGDPVVTMWLQRFGSAVS